MQKQILRFVTMKTYNIYHPPGNWEVPVKSIYLKSNKESRKQSGLSEIVVRNDTVNIIIQQYFLRLFFVV